MKIRSIEIHQIAGINQLELEFNDQMNILCGPNGIGKTTVLECCAHLFSLGQTRVLKKSTHSEASSGPGTVRASVEEGGKTTPIKISITEHEPQKQSQHHGDHQRAGYLISIKTGRLFSYSPLDSIKKDPTKASHVLLEEAQEGIKSTDIKSWFVNRDVFLDKDKSLSAEQRSNIKLAQRCFSELNSTFTFSHVDAGSLDMMVNSPSGTIVHEYLSSGFKSCLVMLLGIIKEIEFRFPRRMVEDFDGIILIDEIELHLHPEWQGKIAKSLTRIFPKVQFIVTTHSPHVIQSAESSEIIPLELKNGKISKRELPESEHGFKGWTVDEVLTDIMGMIDTRTEFFREAIGQFERALDENNVADAEAAFSKLERSLHPQNTLSKLLRLQLKTMERAEP